LAISEYYRRNRDNENESDRERERDLAVFLEQHRQEIDGDGAHNICSCARSDSGWFGSRFFRSNSSRETEATNIDEDVDDDDDENNNHRINDLCFNAWRFLRNLCCGMLCGCHLQLFGICAIAQESRHLQEALPTNARPGLWQRDYITMQPWTEYYPSILRLRFSNEIHCLPHFKALSRLSRHILIAAVAILLFVTLLFLLPIRFAKWQVLIVSLSFVFCRSHWAFENIPALCCGSKPLFISDSSIFISPFFCLHLALRHDCTTRRLLIFCSLVMEPFGSVL
jgi:hypothetical protein